MEHRAVLWQHLRNQLVDPGGGGVRGESLEQPRTDPVAVELVGDGKGDFGAMRVAQPDVGGECDRPHAAVRPGELPEQRAARRPVSLERAGNGFRVDRGRTVEAQITAVGRQREEEVDQDVLVVRCRRAQAKRRSVAKNDVLDQRLQPSRWRARSHDPIVQPPARHWIGDQPSRGYGKLRFGVPRPPRFDPSRPGAHSRQNQRILRRRHEMKPILLATDGSPSAEGATQEAIELAGAFDAPLIVVSVAHVVLPPYGGYYGYAEIAADLHVAELERVTQVLAVTKERAEAAGLTCETVALDGPASEEICRVAGARATRLVVIGAHGWGRVGRLLHGSVSTDVLHQAPCPVLVVHGEEPAPVEGPVVVRAGAAS